MTYKRASQFRINTQMRIEISREACCAQDDQIGPLDLMLEIDPDCSLRDLVRRVVEKGFLQYSSTHTTMIGASGETEIVRVSSPYYINKEPEYFLNPDLPVSEVIKNGDIHFRF
jgi:hypothetical protein